MEMKLCKKCNKEFTPQKGLISYCSLRCRNSRKFSEETNRNKSNATKFHWNKGTYDFRKTGITYITKICNNCGEHFKISRWKDNRQKYCTLQCSVQNDEHRKRMSEIVRKQYQNGKEVYGGRTKWIEVITSKGKIRVQGSYEKRTVHILDKWVIEKKIVDWEYTNDRIEYININGEKSTYLLDFKVFLGDRFYYLEVKGRIVENDFLKWKSVREKGYELVVWKEDDLIKNGG